MNVIQEIIDANNRIHDNILKTPLLYSHWLSDYCGGEVYLKLENEQVTGSFKARGSLNKLRWMEQQQIKARPVTASTGNHGLGFARACDLLDIDGTVFLPTNADSSKVDAIQQYNIQIGYHGEDPYDTEQHARKVADENDDCYISPYNDLQIIGGQGTIGIEILEELPQSDNILATVGGGGLISGIGSYVKDKSPQTSVIGCQPQNSPEMAMSVRAGSYQEMESKPTLSDGSAGGFERDAVTFELCKKLVDEFILASENEIAGAVYKTVKHHKKIIEGAAGVAVAALIQNPEQFTSQKTVIVICGANIAIQNLHSIINEHLKF